jgi:predicted transcriptional regulator
MTINRTSGEINWTPGKDDVGSHMVVVNVSDGKNTTMATFNIKVERAATPVAVNQCFGWPAIFTIVIVGLAFGVVFVETEVGIFALYSLAFLLYTRLKQEMVLDNFVRGQIYGHICENPGLHLAEIQRKLKISAGTLIYHLKTLEREGLVKSFPNGSLRVFFSSSVKVPKELMSLTKAQRWILKAIEERPGISQKELSESTGLSDSTVNRIVHELEERGMVRIEKGKTTQCFIVDN